ncbi:MAG: thiamine phosphate synthase [Bacteroidales bacterium]|nr:thiamine phosphate synthase [Bacteroidales bacterium]
MEDKFQILLFTPEVPHPKEGEILTAALEYNAVDIVHLRHPGLNKEELREILKQIPICFRNRIKLHDHFSLIDELGLLGPHLNSRNPRYEGQASHVSRSCHSMQEVAEAQDYDYVTLSPIFPSISKPGYGPVNRELSPVHKMVALGGVTIERLDEVEKMGFGGAALLGAIWQAQDPYKELRRLKMKRGGRFGLQYITNGTTPAEVKAEVEAVLKGGCRWIQIRMKEADVKTLLLAIYNVKKMCREAGAILLVDDCVPLARNTRIDGVHLGKDDMSPAQARQFLSPMAIIGSTANNLEQVQHLDFANADYAGVGPLRFTTTKKKLAPVLGIEGYEQIFSWLRSSGYEMPVVAIGGVTPEDVPSLLKVGAKGVAVSGAISAAPDPVAATHQFIIKLNTKTLNKPQNNINE